MSDLFCPREELFKGLTMLRQRGHEVIAMHIMDDEELDFRYSGTLRFEGLEGSGSLTCDPAALRAGYMQRSKGFSTPSAAVVPEAELITNSSVPVTILMPR